MKPRDWIRGSALCLSFLSAVLTASAEKYALLVGVENYQQSDYINPLQSACADAKGIALVLEQVCGFSADNVRVLTSDSGDPHLLATRDNVYYELDRLGSKVKPGDTVFVLFSGHGMFISGSSYFLPWDADVRSDGTLTHSGVSDNDIRSSLEKLPASAVVVAYDMCRSDPYKSKAQGANNLAAGEEKCLVLQPRSVTGKGPDAVVILFSCSPEQHSFEWRAMKRGYFCYFLEQGLRKEAADSSGTVHVSNLVSYLQKAVSGAVAREEGQKQDPYPEILGPGANDFVLASGLNPGNGGTSARAAVAQGDDALYAQAFQKGVELEQADKLAEAEQEFANAAAIKETANALDEEAACANSLRHFGEAERLFRKAMEAAPNDGGAVWKLGLYLYTRKRYDQAETLLRKSVSMDGSNVDALNALAFVMLQLRRLDGAERWVDQALALDPTSIQAMSTMSQIERGNHKAPIRSEAAVRGAITHDPTRADLALFLAFLLQEEGRFDEAEAWYQRAQGMSPKDLRVVDQYASFIESQRHDLDRAERMYRKAIDLSPKSPGPHLQFAEFLRFSRKNFRAAEEEYRAAIQADPNNSNAATELARMLSEDEKKDDEAEREYRAATEINPADPGPIAELADYYFDRNRYQESEALYRQAMALDPEDPSTVCSLAFLFRLGKQDLDGAEKLYKQALEIDPNDTSTLTDYARFLEDARLDYDGAEVHYRRAVELEPDDAQKLCALGEFLQSERRNFAEAKTFFERALKSDAENTGALSGLAEVAYAQADYSGAEASYKQLTKLSPKAELYFVRLAEALLKEGKRDEAIASAKQAMQLFASSDSDVKDVLTREPIFKELGLVK